MGEAKRRTELAKREVIEAVGLETAGSICKCAGTRRRKPPRMGRWRSSSSFSLCRACSIAG